MIRDDEFYGITDILHFNVFGSILKKYITKEERVIIKVFRKEEEIVIIETNQFQDTILKDTRKDKNTDLMSFDLTFLRTLERYYCDYQIPGMVYEMIDGVGVWYRVKIEGYHPSDTFLKPFFLKKKVKREDLSKYAKDEQELKKLYDFYDLTKGMVQFSKRKDVEKLFSVIEN